MTTRRAKVQWGKLLLEALVLVVSIYVAIVLEGISEERERHREAVQGDFRALFSENRTVFPRSASWTTMISSGQLDDLHDAELVSDLADFYENRNARLEYNGAFYDQWVTDVARAGVPVVWDQSAGRFLSRDPIEIARLGGRLIGLQDLARGFFGLLEQWRDALDALITEVDTYLSGAS